MQGRRISHYRLVRRLGAGGMGEVYLAEDLALGRSAALKILPERFAPELRSRLRREAETAARLQHPAIATFYEAGESEGVTFIAMELVRGETLRERIRRGPVPVEQAIAWVSCLLEGLAHAHAAGIVHRDIKPENIMVTGERTAKLLDFGLAKDVGGADSAHPTATALTAAGNIVGTLGYLSPEQIRGERVDARADLFAVGAVLYELVSGRPAFGGATPTERIAAVLSRDPEPLRGTGLATALNAVLARALAREPERRFASTAEFLEALRRLGEAPVAELPDTIAVVDLDNVTGRAEDEWIGSAVAESVMADLGRLEGLFVVPREKVLRARAALARDEPADPQRIGLALGCRWILGGGFQRVGSALRLTPRLVDVATGRLVLGEKIDGTVEEIFAMQDRLAGLVAEALDRKRSSPSAAPEAPRIGAYEYFARGRRLWLRLEKGSLDEARQMYEAAVEEDAQYAPAWAGLAAVHAMRFTYRTDRDELERAAEHARRAIELDPSLGEPHIWLAYALMRQGRTEEAFGEAERASALDPENPFGPYFAACCRVIDGGRAEALALYRRALELDPRHAWSWLGLGWTHLELGAFGEAVWSFGEAVALETGGASGAPAGAGAYLAEALRRAGRLDEARRVALEALELVEASDHMYRDTFRAFGLGVLGRVALARGEDEGADAAFVQCLAHLDGRPRTLGGLHLRVQALAGRAQARRSAALCDEAAAVLEGRIEGDDSWLWGMTSALDALAIAEAARACGRLGEARRLVERARGEGLAGPFVPAWARSDA